MSTTEAQKERIQLVKQRWPSLLVVLAFSGMNIWGAIHAGGVLFYRPEGGVAWITYAESPAWFICGVTLYAIVSFLILALFRTALFSVIAKSRE
jgi:hypothetical protein